MDYREALLTREKKFFLQLKKRMDEYNSDFEEAVRRSAEIEESDRMRAEQEIQNWEILERFGMI